MQGRKLLVIDDNDAVRTALDVLRELKQNGFRADQVQAFLPSPMASAPTMYHTGKNPLRRVTRSSELVPVAKGLRQRRLLHCFRHEVFGDGRELIERLAFKRFELQLPTTDVAETRNRRRRRLVHKSDPTARTNDGQVPFEG